MIAGVVTGSPEWYTAREEVLQSMWDNIVHDMLDEDMMPDTGETPEGEY